jgi:hypothetical protein
VDLFWADYPYLRVYEDQRQKGCGFLERSSPGTADIMDYDSDQWIFDYPYLRVYEDQRQKGAVFLSEAPQEAVMLISGSVEEEGEVDLLPVYLLPETPPSPAQQGDLYQVVLLDEDGREAVRHSLKVFWSDGEGEDHHHETQGRFDARLPLPGRLLSAVQIYRGETLVAERRLDSPGLRSMVLQSSLSISGVELTWDEASRPALLQASWDGGQNWQTLAVDVTGGSFTIDAEWFLAKTVLFRALMADQASFHPDKVLETEVDFSRFEQ